MTSRQHQDWIDHGRPDSGLARPLAQLRDVLRGAGYTVFDFPNDAHLDAQPPEDHTFYSETGWPGKSPKWWRHAIDIMPPTRPGLPSLTDLGRRIVADRNAGRITWLKYINWPSTGLLSEAVQDKWEPGHSRRNSTDTGHIHLSSITGVETLDAPYNPLAAEGDDMAAAEETLALLKRALNGFGDKGLPTENLLGTWVSGFQQGQAATAARMAAIQTTLAAQTQTITNLTTLLQQAGSPDVAPLVQQIQAMTAQLGRLADTEAAQSAQIASLQAKLAAAAKAEADTLGTA